MRYCGMCGKTEEKSRIIKHKTKGLLCESCYTRERLNPITYELPNKGEVVYSPEGKPICHACGKAYDKILAHAWQAHKLSAYEYKVTYGLETTKGIMSKESTELAKQRLEDNYKQSVEINLMEKGKKTRYKVGHKGRTKDQVSEQTRKELARRLKTYTRGNNKCKSKFERSV